MLFFCRGFSSGDAGGDAGVSGERFADRTLSENADGDAGAADGTEVRRGGTPDDDAAGACRPGDVPSLTEACIRALPGRLARTPDRLESAPPSEPTGDTSTTLPRAVLTGAGCTDAESAGFAMNGGSTAATERPFDAPAGVRIRAEIHQRHLPNSDTDGGFPPEPSSKLAPVAHYGIAPNQNAAPRRIRCPGRE